MAYRLYLQPLTEYTETKPLKGEVLVNTVSADISIADGNGGSISATKGMKKELDFQKYFLRLVAQDFKSMYDDLEILKNKLTEDKKETERIETIVEELKRLVDEMDIMINTLTFDLKEDYDALVSLYNKLASVSAIFGENTFRILQMERINNELGYMSDIYKANTERIKEDVIKMKEAKSEIDALVNSKVDRSEVMSWLDNYVSRVRALRGLNSAVVDLNFNYTGFE